MLLSSILILSLLVGVASAQHLVTSAPPNFSQFVFRLAQSGITANSANITSTQTQFNGQVQVFLVVNGVPTEQIATISAGADSVTTYFTRSLFDANGQAPGQVALRFNTSGVAIGGTDCQLTPFSSQSTRTTCTLVQTVQFLVPTTPVCSFVGGTCSAPFLNVSNAVNQFAVVASQEKLADRVCDASPLFVRGVVPTCANRIVRANSSGVLASEVIALKAVVNPTPFTTGGDVPSTLLVRANDYRFENPTSTSLSGASRSYEAVVPATGVIAVAARTTGFVKLVNAAHREFTPVGGSPQTEFSLTFVLRDAQNSVVHFETINTGQQSTTFVELATGAYTVNVYSGRNTRQSILVTNPNTLTGTVSTGTLTVAENRYYLVAVATSTTDPTFQTDALIAPLDVTPAATNTVGTTEHQIVNLLLAPSLSQDVKLLRNQVLSADSLQCTGFGAVNNGQAAAPFAAQSAALPLEVALGSATGCATCTRSQYAASFSFAPVTAGQCGKRVTVLIGRPYQLDTQTNVPFCVTPLNTTSVEIGDLTFLGTRFSKFAGSPNPQQAPQPVTFEIQNCQCTPVAATCTEVNTCDTARIIALGAAVGGVSSAVGGVSAAVGGVATAVGGVSSAVTAVGAAVGVVQTQARNLNVTLVATRTAVNAVKNDIEQKNKGLADTLDDVKNDVSDIKNDVSDIKNDASDIKKDLEEKNKGLIDRVKDLSDECKQACDSP